MTGKSPDLLIVVAFATVQNIDTPGMALDQGRSNLAFVFSCRRHVESENCVDLRPDQQCHFELLYRELRSFLVALMPFVGSNIAERVNKIRHTAISSRLNALQSVVGVGSPANPSLLIWPIIDTSCHGCGRYRELTHRCKLKLPDSYLIL